MSKFIDELKRRNVVRVTLAYVVVGWLILQVSDILLDFTGAPEWVGKAIIGLLAPGPAPEPGHDTVCCRARYSVPVAAIQATGRCRRAAG